MLGLPEPFFQFLTDGVVIWHNGVGGKGEVPWYFHIHVGSDHFVGFKILNFIFFFWGGGGRGGGGGGAENEYFWGNEDFVEIFLGGSLQNWTGFRRVISMHFRVFSSVHDQNSYGDILGGAKISNIFWGYAWYSRYFWGKTVDAGSKPLHEDKMREPPPPHGTRLPMLCRL